MDCKDNFPLSFFFLLYYHIYVYNVMLLFHSARQILDQIWKTFPYRTWKCILATFFDWGSDPHVMCGCDGMNAVNTRIFYFSKENVYFIAIITTFSWASFFYNKYFNRYTVTIIIRLISLLLSFLIHLFVSTLLFEFFFIDNTNQEAR